MPGIVGLVTTMPRARAEAELCRMLQTLRHEPGYRNGSWIDESLGLYVAWTALPDSFSDGMPLRNEQDDVVLVFSGEEFPEPGTVARLKREGHTFDGAGPSYLVHLSEGDDAFPAGLNGWFHGLLADRRRRTATLFNDRYGMHRLYYHESADAFYFSAEAKAILAISPDTRRADLRGLGELVACGCVLEDRTLFKDVHILPSASAWVFRNGAPAERKKYFHQREWEDQPALDAEAYYREIRDVFSRNLPRYFEASERIAVSLTGGLDTRMVMAWSKPAPGALPSYTFGGMFRECHDVRVAREISRICGQSHEVIPVGDDFLRRFSNYAERTVFLTDGCADVSRSADLYVNERARGIAPVRMTGNYGGEVLRRVRAFKPVEPLPGLFRDELVSHVRQARDTYRAVSREHPLSFAVFRQAPWHHYGLAALERTQLSLRSPFLDNDFVRTVFRAPQSMLTSDDVCLRLIADGNPALSRVPTDRGLGGQRSSLGVAAVRRLREFSFKAEYAYDYGMPQWLTRLDHLASPLHLERLFLGRHKFYHYRVWYRDALSKYVKDVLLDSTALSRPYLERKTVEAVVNSHVKGVRNFTTSIHKLLTLELVHRLLIDAQ